MARARGGRGGGRGRSGEEPSRARAKRLRRARPHLLRQLLDNLAHLRAVALVPLDPQRVLLRRVAPLPILRRPLGDDHLRLAERLERRAERAHHFFEPARRLVAVEEGRARAGAYVRDGRALPDGLDALLDVLFGPRVDRPHDLEVAPDGLRAARAAVEEERRLVLVVFLFLVLVGGGARACVLGSRGGRGCRLLQVEGLCARQVPGGRAGRGDAGALSRGASSARKTRKRVRT